METQGTDQAPYDVAIIGGGPAGMAAALVAGRALLRTLVVNEANPRNAVSRASHGYLTRDGAHALELLEIAKTQLQKYASVHYVETRVTDLKRLADGFALGSTEQQWRADRVVLATGFRDNLATLPLPGIEHIYGTTAFPCPFCDGFEHAGERWAVFMAENVEHFAKVLRMWTDDLIAFTNGTPLDPAILSQLTQAGVQVETAPVTAIESTNHHLQAIHLADGQRIERDIAFIGETFAQPASPFADQLGIPTITLMGRQGYKAEPGGRTNIPNLFIAGDAHRHFGGITTAAYDGATCMQHIIHDLAQQRFHPN